MLLACGNIVDEISGQGQTPLMIAAENGNTDVLEELIENKSNVHLKQQDGSFA